ncbi:hypothetical protein ABIQ69_11555 [Agromyces sp. G08B096]|uniref:Tail fiber protein n=1 Tax=Agromyces sp. G08B096 TaxID=3156399 RepID=A0AAU7W4I5_9MICO
MVDTLYPANAVTDAPAYNGRILRQAGAVDLAGAVAGRPLGARSGVRPGTPTNTVTTTSSTWTCQPFAGVADVMTAAESGPYRFAFDAAASGSIVAADTQARKDIIYVEVKDPAEGVGSTPSVTRKYLPGAPSGTPSAPSIPPTERGFVIAEINVPATGGGAPTVTWVAPYCVAAGGVLPVPAGVYPTSPYLGQYVDDPVKGLLRYDGTGWVPQSPLIMPGAGLVGGTPPAGTRFIEKSGAFLVNTNGSGDAGYTYPTPFPNGVLSIELQRRDFSNYGATIQILNATQTLSVASFRVYQPGGAPLTGVNNVPFTYRAIGW